MENSGQNYSPVYVSRGVLGWESGRKKYTELNGNKFPLSLKLPKHILNAALFVKVSPYKSITYFYVVKFCYIFFTKYKHMLRFLSTNCVSTLLSRD
jgi:hypothetical protein